MIKYVQVWSCPFKVYLKIANYFDKYYYINYSNYSNPLIVWTPKLNAENKKILTLNIQTWPFLKNRNFLIIRTQWFFQRIFIYFFVSTLSVPDYFVCRIHHVTWCVYERGTGVLRSKYVSRSWTQFELVLCTNKYALWKCTYHIR